MFKLQVLIIVCATHISLVLLCDYSRFGNSHTMCQYTGQGCSITKRVFSNADKAEAVRVHNVLRQKVATGKQAGQPGATNMKVVTWDEELARIAQRWADQCKVGHDQNRRTLKYTNVGQNVYFYGSSSNANLNVKNAVESWYNEVTRPGFNKNKIKSFQPDFGTGHYTQVVWADTEAIGCGYAGYVSQRMNTILVVCNYGPAGNVMRQSMYEEGRACSKCGKGKCCSRFPGLCTRS